MKRIPKLLISIFYFEAKYILVLTTTIIDKIMSGGAVFSKDKSYIWYYHWFLDFFLEKKHWEGFNLNNSQDNISINRIKVCTIYLTLNLLLPHVVLINVTTHNYESTDFSIMDCYTRNLLFVSLRFSPKD